MTSNPVSRLRELAVLVELGQTDDGLRAQLGEALRLVADALEDHRAWHPPLVLPC